MPIIDLRNHIVESAGIWRDPVSLAKETPFTFSMADTCSPARLLLRWPGDEVTLTGPLRIKVTLQSEDLTYQLGSRSAPEHIRQIGIDSALKPLATADAEMGKGAGGVNTGFSFIGAGTLQAATIYSYALDIPAGQAWSLSYNHPHASHRRDNAFYDRILIEVAGLDRLAEPVAASCDLPCDFAVLDHGDLGAFFPAACEPCEPTALMRMPPLAPALSAPSADGGCVRTRFFNGMFITKEDLETEQRYVRVKNRLRNRAAGQGVVWGLNVGRSGDKVCVLPGYGVDCCGNDLTVTTMYEVDIDALLRDPASCLAGDATPRQMALLLEYVECPGEPRPVHNDPCAPSETACEPSRIRETVRLRLVPPRPPKTAGPMADFLKTAQALHERYGSRLETVSDTPAEVPIRLRVRGEGLDLSISPGDKEQASTFAALSEVTFSAETYGVPAAVFTAGTLRVSDSGDGGELASTPLALMSLPGAAGATLTLNPGSALIVTLDGWRVETPLAAESGWADTGTATFDVGVRGDSIYTAARPSEQRRVQPHRITACGEPCQPPTSRFRRVVGAVECAKAAVSVYSRSTIRWPWLHRDPLAQKLAGDPKALAIGILGAWLRSSAASAVEADVIEPWSFSKLAASTLHRAAWLLFYGVDASDDKRDVGDALQKLLGGWCAAMLYPGPSCEGDPHGVVIGCTTVSAGRIGDIDPFGGRRYVVQWPLISHWAGQVGVAPLELSATRLFSTLCCVASLPRPKHGGSAPTVLTHLGGRGDEGVTYLAFGTETGVASAWKQQTSQEWTVNATYEITVQSFLAHIVSALQGRTPSSSHSSSGGNAVVGGSGAAVGGSGAAGGRTLIERYTLGGLVEPGVVSLVVARPAG